MRKNFIKIFLPAIGTIFLDQITKYLIFNGFINMEYSKNTGIAFGISMPFYLLSGINVFLLFLIVYLAYKELNLSKILSQISMGIILGGAIGNIIDRLRYGYVIDFISIWKYPSFNIADIGITAGIFIIVLFYGKLKLR
ncbi:signal peptidase II [Candidatus Peregrinibacteria bacterium]|nr:signal peptidase II [Candidatus Peregrinibacteria bacterium]